MEDFPVREKGSHEPSNSRKKQRLSFYRPSPQLPYRYISTAASFSFFSFFFSFSRKRDKQERAGIDLSEALHEHQQRSANKSKRVGDPPKRAPNSI